MSYTGPRNPNPQEGEAGIVIYGYVPSLALSIIGVVTFAIILAIHIFYSIKKRGHGETAFYVLFAVGSLMEAGGYGARISSHFRPFLVSTFVAQYFLIVVAPVLFSAAIYLSLTLVVRSFPQGDRLLLISRRLVLAFFITADVICIGIQVAGAALIGVSESRSTRGQKSPVTPKQANDILLAGLVCQCFSFLNFLVILGVAIIRARRISSTNHASDTALKRILWIIMVTSDLILLRTVFRLAETAQGIFGFASTHESLFGTLEYLPVILALGIWAVFPPTKYLSQGGIPEHAGTSSGLAESKKEEVGRVIS